MYLQVLARTSSTAPPHLICAVTEPREKHEKTAKTQWTTSPFAAETSMNSTLWLQFLTSCAGCYVLCQCFWHCYVAEKNQVLSSAETWFRNLSGRFRASQCSTFKCKPTSWPPMFGILVWEGWLWEININTMEYSIDLNSKTTHPCKQLKRQQVRTSAGAFAFGLTFCPAQVPRL